MVVELCILGHVVPAQVSLSLAVGRGDLVIRFDSGRGGKNVDEGVVDQASVPLTPLASAGLRVYKSKPCGIWERLFSCGQSEQARTGWDEQGGAPEG